MKKPSRKKLALETMTVRTLLDIELSAAQGGLPPTSVGTCTACTPTYNPDCFSRRSICA
jgi:hypothetical protein